MKHNFKYISTIAVLLCALTISVSAQQPTKQEIRDARRSGSALPSSVTTLTSSAQGQYDLLVEQKNVLDDQISALNLQMEGQNKRTQKKLQKELDQKNDELAILNRKMGSFPESIRNPQSVQQSSDTDFMQRLEDDAQEKINSSDPYRDAISSDPALEKTYREYLRQNGYVPLYDNQTREVVSREGDNKLTYRIMLTIEQKTLPTSTFRSMDSVLEQRMRDGSIIYYQGNYATEGEAQSACDKIVKESRFRDAFVVAMRGAQRIEL